MCVVLVTCVISLYYRWIEANPFWTDYFNMALFCSIDIFLLILFTEWIWMKIHVTSSMLVKTGCVNQSPSPSFQRTPRFWDSPAGLQLASDVQDLLLGFYAGFLGRKEAEGDFDLAKFWAEDFFGGRYVVAFFWDLFFGGGKICISFFEGVMTIID